MRAVTYRKVDVDGVGVFYRKAGPKDAPTIVLLHGFPTASHMFRNLIPQLADRAVDLQQVHDRERVVDVSTTGRSIMLTTVVLTITSSSRLVGSIETKASSPVPAAPPTASEQVVPGDAAGISYEDKAGRWHDELSSGDDRPEMEVEG